MLPDLSGTVLGHYDVGERIGAGRVAVVYRATERPGERPVALKVLDPDLTGRPGFLSRFVDETATISRLDHPRIVPVYEIASRGELTYVTMRLVRGGTLKTLLWRGGLDVAAAQRIVEDVASALHGAHEAGVVHQDLKPSNVLVEPDGSVLVSDFGLTPARYGCATGAPVYLSPEQAAGAEADRRTDVHALALLLFELLTGTTAHPGAGHPLRDAGGRIASALARNPELSPELDQVLFRALARDPADRPESVADFLDALGSVGFGSHRRRRPPDPLRALIEASPDPVLVMDASGRITHWNGRAESLFGWPREQIIGAPVLTSLVAPRHRELFERVLATSAARPAWPAGRRDRAAEIAVLHRDGHRITLEVSLSPVELPTGATSLVAFCRDVTERNEAARLLAMHDAVDAALAHAEMADQVIPTVLEAIGGAMGWTAGAVWRPVDGGSRLRCVGFWHAASVAGSELERLSRDADCAVDVSFPGRAWSSAELVWRPDLVAEAASAREVAAVRAGLRGAVAFPIEGDEGLVGVLEFFGATGDAPTAARVAAVEAAGRRFGRFLRQMRPAPARRIRYQVDSRNTHLAFSCSFMRFMTVHGRFRDFNGGVEVEGSDPTTARAECTIRTGSVETGSLDRDYHMGSADFFAVERYPTMVFRSSEVRPLGDERFRLFGDLTIRDVTRPIRLDVRLEDWEIDASGAERATLSAVTVIHRQDWFLDWEKALQAGRWIVGDQVRLDLVITLVRRAGVRELR